MARKKGNRKVVQQSEFSDEEDFKTGASLNRWETAEDVELDSEDECNYKIISLKKTNMN